MSLTQEDLQAIANLLTPMRNDITDMKTMSFSLAHIQ